VEKGITILSQTVITATNQKDPYWDDSARDLFKAIIYGMLEDSASGKITEDNFSFDTVLRIFDSFSDSKTNYDNGYFRNRDIETSKAHQLARKCIIEQADNTRRCISSAFAAKISKFRDTSVRRITCANSFEMSELDGDQPTVIFVTYKDEECLHYEIISMFLSNLYSELIAISRKKGISLERPFYFLLDEFGNLPRFNDFDKVISACGGRNIWFLLILQSYAQLNNVYGKETAEIIKDNLNTHIFFGTNNPETKREFSLECGYKTIISPMSALNGNGETIERYEKDTVALVPVSKLNSITPGECIVTQMREDVLWSKMERSYLCPEFDGEQADVSARGQKISFSSEKYRYIP
jgi:type IV secretion system protein VirD4